MYWVDFELMDKDERIESEPQIKRDRDGCKTMRRFELVGSFYNVYIEYKAYNHLRKYFP